MNAYKNKRNFVNVVGNYEFKTKKLVQRPIDLLVK